MIRLPEKQIIVNNVNQLSALKFDSSGTYVDIVTPNGTTDGFHLLGFLGPIAFGKLKAYSGNTRIKSQVAVAAVKQIATFTPAAVVGAAAGEVFRLVWDSLDKTPTEFQNVPLEKRYQVSINLANNATAIQVGTAIHNAINADKNAPVTSSVNGGTGVVTLTAKDENISFVLYTKPAAQGGLITGTFAVTTPATKGINTYDQLKSINWAKNLDFDQNVEYFPEYGATYKSYKFIFKNTGFVASPDIAGAVAPADGSEVEVCIWVKTGLALITTLDLIVTDANGALA